MDSFRGGVMAFRPLMPGILSSGNQIAFPTEYKLPSSHSVITTNNFSWTNPTNVYADDDVGMETGSQTWSSGTSSDVLRFTDFGFTTSDIPSGSSIDGVEIEWSFRNNQSRIFEFFLFDATNGVSPDSETSISSSGVSFGVLTRGDATDLFGNVSISDADIRSSSFGVQFLVSAYGFTPSEITNVEVDYIKVRIHGTPP